MRWGLAPAGCVALVAAAGCVMNESKPLPKVNPIQADRQIPQDELLDVVVHPLDPGIPPNLDPKALDKQRINPDIRKAESRYVATLLRSTLETSGQWGAVRVAPESAQFIDVIVSGKIVESTGAKLALDITVKDSTGRVDRKSTRLNSSHLGISYAVFCLQKKKVVPVPGDVHAGSPHETGGHALHGLQVAARARGATRIPPEARPAKRAGTYCARGLTVTS